MIVKVQRAIYPPNAEAMIYNEGKKFHRLMKFEDLPEEVQKALHHQLRVFWNVSSKHFKLTWYGQAENQDW